MSDPATAAFVLAGLKGVLDVTNTALDALAKLKELLKEDSTPEAREVAVLELQHALLEAKTAAVEARSAAVDAKEQAASAREELLEKRNRIRELEEELQASKLGKVMRADYETRDGVLWLEHDGPFCKPCTYRENRPVPINELAGKLRRLGRYKCTQCSGVAGPADKAQDQRMVQARLRRG